MVGLMGWGSVPEQGWRKGPWTPEEDKLLSGYVSLHGEGRWSSVARSSGLNRSGKSCRLRWVNYLRPGLKRGHITRQEEAIIIELHALWGNKWSTIARYLPGRTDNEIKNYWRTHSKKNQKPCCQKKEKPKTNHQTPEPKQKQEDGTKPDTTKANEAHGKQGMLSMEHQCLPVIYQDLQTRLELFYMYPNLEGQCLPGAYQDDHHGLWSDLWNLDDMQNQAANVFSTGGNSSQNYHTGGYIF